jgi:hypothetical protein
VSGEICAIDKGEGIGLEGPEKAVPIKGLGIGLFGFQPDLD